MFVKWHGMCKTQTIKTVQAALIEIKNFDHFGAVKQAENKLKTKQWHVYTFKVVLANMLATDADSNTFIRVDLS